jgi:ribosomal protein S18 acetylase RimI-like enzyme
MKEINLSLLPQLDQYLRMFLPKSLKILGEVNVVLRQQGFERRFFVDGWPELTTVVATSVQKENDTLAFTRTFITCFSLNKNNLQKLLSSVEQIEWNKSLCFVAYPLEYLDVLEDLVKDKGGYLDTEFGKKNQAIMMSLSLEDIPKCEVEEDLSVEKVHPDAAEYIKNTWGYSDIGAGCLSYIHWLIETQPSVGLYKNKTLIAHMLGQYDGSLGILYVHPSHRSRGLAKYVVANLARQMIESQGFAYVHVVANNQISYEMHKRCGFKDVENVLWLPYRPASQELVQNKQL